MNSQTAPKMNSGEHHSLDEGQDAIQRDASGEAAHAHEPMQLPSWFAMPPGEGMKQPQASQQAAPPAWARHDMQAPASAPQMTQRAAPVHAGGEDEFSAFQRRMETRLQNVNKRIAETRLKCEPPEAVSLPRRSRRASWQDDSDMMLQMAEETGDAFPLPAARRQVQKPVRWRILTIMLLVSTAAVAGSLGGYSIANPDSVTRLLAASTAGVGHWFNLDAEARPTSTAANGTVINKKPVQMARIEVRDVQGPVNGLIPLAISATPSDADTPLSFRISGLPPEAYITSGTQIGQGQWELKTADLEKARLVVPRATTNEIGLEVTALESNSGIPAAPAQDMRVALNGPIVSTAAIDPEQAVSARSNPDDGSVLIAPVSALPDQGYNKTEPASAASSTPIPQPLEVASAAPNAMISKGETLLKSGDIVSARQYFLKAETEDPAAASYGVARTYDPAVYMELNVVGLQPDSKLAAEWYGKAAARGHAAATEALKRLSAPAQP